MLLYAVAAAMVLAASCVAWIVLGDDEGGTLLTIAGVLFWVSGLTLTAIGVVALGRRLGFRFPSRTPERDPDEHPE